MKKTLFIFFVIVCSACFAQAPIIQWQKSFGGTNLDAAASIQQTFDGGYITAGTVYSNNGNASGLHGVSDFWVIKTDALGTIQWQKCFGSSGDDEGNSIEQTLDGGYIVCGHVENNDGNATGVHFTDNAYDFWVIKIDSLGEIVWQKALGGFQSDIAKCVKQTTDGGYIVVGTTNSPDGDVTLSYGGSDVWVVRLDSVGNLLWQKSYGGSASDSGVSIALTNDGGFIFTGQTDSTDGDVTGQHGSDCWVVKINASGNIIWAKVFGGSDTDNGCCVKQTIDNGYIVCGVTNSVNGDITVNHGSTDCWLIKLDALGNLLWQKTYGGIFSDCAFDVSQTIDNGYILTGYSSSGVNAVNSGDITESHGFADGWVVKTNAVGNIQWQKSIGSSGDEFFFSIHQTSDGGFITAGRNTTNNGDVSGNHGNLDFWVVKLSPASLSTENFETNNLIVFPNPSISLLKLQIPIGIQLDKVIITDIVGKQIFQKTNDLSNINVENMASGTYVISAFSANKIFQTKFIKQ